MIDEINDLIAELQHVVELLEDEDTDEAFEQLQMQSGTIGTMLEDWRGVCNT